MPLLSELWHIMWALFKLSSDFMQILCYISNKHTAKTSFVPCMNMLFSLHCGKNAMPCYAEFGTLRVLGCF